MEAPVHIGGKFAAQREYWRKVGLIGGSVGTVLALVFGFWFWYAWIGSKPKVYFSIRWDNISHSGTSWIVGGDQLVFLHGGTLARYNLQTKQKVWSLDLVTQQQVDDELKKEDAYNTRVQHETGSSPDVEIPRVREKNARLGLESDFTLYGSGKNVWIEKGAGMGDEDPDAGNASPQSTLTRYDWDTGNVAQQITLTNNFGVLKAHGDELLAVGTAADGSQSVTHISLTDGGMHTEEFSGAPAAPVAESRRPATGSQGGGIPLSRDQAGQTMNPAKVAEQAQNMTLPGRLALPALIANSEHNQQINQEIKSEDAQQQHDEGRLRGHRHSAPQPSSASPQSTPDQSDEPDVSDRNFSLVPDGDGYIAFGLQMIKENIVEHDAMRAPPQHSALNNPNLGTANETAAVNEQLNELQRNSGGGTVTEDQSTYQIVIRRPGSATADWTGQVVGPPQFYPLTTVNVLAAGKTIIVFDKTNKKLWQSTLTYNITGGDKQPGGLESSPYGAGPCVENNGTLYIFDQAVLTAFDPTSGNARWRIPSVGVVGLFFDDKGAVFVNTTTGNPDDIKYSREIDVSKATQAVVMKVDPATGTILWRYNPGGYISYLSGKYIFSYRDYDPGDEEDQSDEATSAILGTAYLKIIRINPSNGHVMWEHDEGRAPVDLQFDGNMISIVLKKEVEVLKFFSM
jgi:hypothetical protein